MATREFGATQTRPNTSSATEQAAEVASTASEAVGQVTQEAGDQLRQVGDTVKREVGGIADEVAAQGRNLVEDAKTKLSEQAQTETERLAESLRKIGDQLNGLLSGQPPEDGPVRDYVEQAASKVNQVAQRVQQRGFDGVVQDVERFARRRPGIFLLGAAAAGAVVGRVLRGAKADSQSNGSASPALASGAPGTGLPPVTQIPPDTTLVTPPAPPIMPSTSTTSPTSMPSGGR